MKRINAIIMMIVMVASCCFCGDSNISDAKRLSYKKIHASKKAVKVIKSFEGWYYKRYDSNNPKEDVDDIKITHVSDSDRDWTIGSIWEKSNIFDGNLDKVVTVDEKGYPLIEDFKKNKNGDTVYYVKNRSKKLICKLNLNKISNADNPIVCKSTKCKNYMYCTLPGEKDKEYILFSYSLDSKRIKKKKVGNSGVIGSGEYAYVVNGDVVEKLNNNLEKVESVKDDSIKGDTILFGVKNNNLFYLTNNAVYMYDVAGKTSYLVSQLNELVIVNTEIMVCKDGIYFVGMSGDSAALYRIDKDGKIQLIHENVSDFTQTSKGVYFTVDSDDGMQKTFLYNNGKEKYITNKMNGNLMVGTKEGIILSPLGVTDGSLYIYKEDQKKLKKIYQY